MKTDTIGNESFQERRRFNRLDKNFSMRFKVLLPDLLPVGELDKEGRVCDIGAGGLRFMTGAELNKNDQLLILLEFSCWKVDGEEWIPTGNPADRGKLKVLGRVMWCGKTESSGSEQEVGICFVGRIY